MFFTFFTVALFVAASIRGVSAAFAMNSPQLVQCQSVKVSWEPATPPYNLIAARGNDMCGDPLVEIGDFNVTKTNWVVAVPAGTQVYLSVIDSSDKEAWSNLLTVGPSSDASCLSKSHSPSGSSPSPSPSPSPSTGVTPLGAANAGTITSSAITARQASLPVLALAGLTVVVALL